MDSALQKVINLAGNRSKLARQLGIKPQAIQQWERVPVDRVLAIESITGISRHELRPDIYGDEARSA